MNALRHRQRFTPYLLASVALLAPSSLACTDGETSSPEDLSATRESVAGGHDDTNDPVTADVVVQLHGNNGCTGTLITPTAVLTAKHCVCNAVSSFDVEVGSGVTAVPRRRYRSTINDRVHPALTFGACPQASTDLYGDDVAIVFLDDVQPSDYSPAPAFDYAYIHRPTFDAPCASDSAICPDVNGGNYAPALSVAGFAAADTVAYRQVGTLGSARHYAGHPSSVGQFWQTDRSGVALNEGDSGGPLFVTRVDEHGHAFRDVLGVASAKDGSSNYHTDITRGAIKDFVIRSMTDNLAGHTLAWRAKHPNVKWLGEVDYLGACQRDVDADCDHFFDAGDDCPRVFNPDQLATKGVELGDACNGPPPGVAPTRCSATLVDAPDKIHIECDSPGFATVLELLEPSGFVRVASAPLVVQPQKVTYDAHPLPFTPNAASATYRVCSTSPTSQQEQCGSPMSVALHGTPQCTLNVLCGDDVWFECTAFGRDLSYSLVDGAGVHVLGTMSGSFTTQPFLIHVGVTSGDVATFRLCNAAPGSGQCAPDVVATLPHAVCDTTVPNCKRGFHDCGNGCVPASQRCQ